MPSLRGDELIFLACGTGVELGDMADSGAPLLLFWKQAKRGKTLAVDRDPGGSY